MVLDMMFAGIALLFALEVVGSIRSTSSFIRMPLGEAMPFLLGFGAYAASGIWIGLALVRGAPLARMAQVAWCLVAAATCAWEAWDWLRVAWEPPHRVSDQHVIDLGIAFLLHLGMTALLFTPASRAFFARVRGAEPGVKS